MNAIKKNFKIRVPENDNRYQTKSQFYKNDNHYHNDNDNRSYQKSQSVTPTKLNSFTNLIGSIRDMRLTKSLEIFEQQGFTGDLAVFFMSISQEVAA